MLTLQQDAIDRWVLYFKALTRGDPLWISG